MFEGNDRTLITGPFIRRIINILYIYLFITLAVSAAYADGNKYIGTIGCKLCHQSEKQGSQFFIWQKSKHAEAYQTLTSAKSAEIAKAKGLKKSAAESPECLTCHAVTVDAKLIDKTFDTKEGVQCESCHGAGSSYKTMSVMKNKAKAVAAGLVEYKDQASIEKLCKTCHNKKSPTYKEFRFREMWDVIKHPVPKKTK